MIDWSNFESTVVIEVTRPTGKFTCSGVAIKHDIILTAAHCLEGEILSIKVFNSAVYHPDDAFYAVKSFELHPDYNKKNSNFQADLAKIQLATPLPSNTMIFPILKQRSSLQGKLLRLGYGAREGKNVRTLITPEFRSFNLTQDVLELNDLFSYSGDSGGPVFVQREGQMFLIAIHSTLSSGPEGRYSFNPLVSMHRDWATASLI